MFNVSLKMTRDNLVDINELIEKRVVLYQKYLIKNAADPIIRFENFNDFRLKMANTLMKKHHVKNGKEFSVSINANSWLAWREFFIWLSLKENIDSNPYYSMLYRDWQTQIHQQLYLRHFPITQKKLN